jgi:uncharacterized protein with HEPN domain
MSGSSGERGLRQWLQDIVTWEQRMAEYLLGMNEETFAVDRRTQDAVIRCLACIGEASRRVPGLAADELPPGIEFLQAYWTRNRLVHGYYDVNLQRVWLTATQSAPALAADVMKLLDELK